MTYRFFFQMIFGTVVFVITNFQRLNAGITPLPSQHTTSTVKKKSNSFFTRFKNQVLFKLKSNKKSISKNNRKILLSNWFGKLIAILLFFIPGTLGHVASFIMLLSTLSKSGDNVYFVGALISLISAFWCLLGCLMVGKDSREKYAIIFIEIPALIILVIACVQLFSIIFGASGANFVYGLLSLALAGLVMLFARILGFN